MIIYKFNRETKEFLGNIEVNEAFGTDIPFTTEIKPKTTKKGFTQCFNTNLQKWEYVEDNRGSTIYSKTTKEEIEVDYLGALKAEHTLLVPNQFDKWDIETNSWIEDGELKKEYEKSLIPKSITLRQARLYLLKVELLDDLEDIIKQNRAYEIEWEYASVIERNSPLVAILGVALNLDEEAIDNMFIKASKI